MILNSIQEMRQGQDREGMCIVGPGRTDRLENILYCVIHACIWQKVRIDWEFRKVP